MKTKILVIIISFIFLFTYNVQCFATDIMINKEFETITKNQETDDIAEDNINKENIVQKIDENKIENNISTEENNNLEYIIENENDNNTSEEQIESIYLYNNIGTVIYSGMINIDSPQNNQLFNTRKDGMEINICGWAVSNTLNTKLQCFIDDSFINTNIERVERKDVNELVSQGFGGVSINPKAGFNCYINLNLVKSGTHLFKIKEFSEDNQLICENQITLKIENQPYIRKNVY